MSTNPTNELVRLCRQAQLQIFCWFLFALTLHVVLIACGPTVPDDVGTAETSSSSSSSSEGSTTTLPTTSEGDSSTSTGEGSSSSSGSESGSESSTGEVPTNFCALCNIFGDCLPGNTCLLDRPSGLFICVPPCNRGDTCEGIQNLCEEDLGLPFTCKPHDDGMLCLPVHNEDETTT